MADRVGQHLGNYRLTRLLGRGGFAEVYLGEHRRLKTQAAIKVLHTQLADSDVEGFLKEAQFIASLEHPHIVRILDFDVEESTPFLVMSYAPNGTLRQLHPKDTVLPLPTVVGYVKQVADALQYAHDEKLIHRDIKPENMLLGRRNEILLSDFGIALVAQSSRYQSTQEMAGTMAYMPPEQIQGKPRPASDQYALGIVVYEWLTGDRPFHGSAIEIVAQHLAVPPASLREKVPTIPRDVEQVVMTALAKDPKERFMSVQAFANALEQAGQLGAPTFVKPPGLPVQPPRVETSSSLVARAVVTPPLPPTELVVASQPVGTILYTYRGHSTVDWSPDGKYIASGYGDGMQVWDMAANSQVFSHREHSRLVKAVAWSPDGKRIASGGEDKTVQVWDMVNRRSIYAYYGHSRTMKSLAWSPNGSHIASASEDKTVQVWNATNGMRSFTYHGQGFSANAVKWSPNDRYIVSASDDYTVHVLDSTKGVRIIAYNGHSGWVGAVACSPNGQRIASGGYDTTVQIWDVAGTPIYTYRGHSGSITAITWSPSGEYIASGDTKGKVRVWYASNGNHAYTFHNHFGSVLAVAWSPDGKHIASTGEDKTLQIWVAP
ncbi:MAG: protein kinase domain-containing protein [Ktedonobacteraceae bacterium]